MYSLVLIRCLCCCCRLFSIFYVHSLVLSFGLGMFAGRHWASQKKSNHFRCKCISILKNLFLTHSPTFLLLLLFLSLSVTVYCTFLQLCVIITIKHAFWHEKQNGAAFDKQISTHMTDGHTHKHTLHIQWILSSPFCRSLSACSSSSAPQVVTDFAIPTFGNNLIMKKSRQTSPFKHQRIFVYT